MKGEEEV